MTPEVARLVEKAKRSQTVGHELLVQGHGDFAVSRAYYAMCYLAEALLTSVRQPFSKHSAVIAAVGKHFVKTGEFSPASHAALRAAFDAQNIVDHGHDASFPEDAARSILEQADAFVAEACTYLGASQTHRGRDARAHAAAPVRCTRLSTRPWSRCFSALMWCAQQESRSPLRYAGRSRSVTPAPARDDDMPHLSIFTIKA